MGSDQKHNCIAHAQAFPLLHIYCSNPSQRKEDSVIEREILMHYLLRFLLNLLFCSSVLLLPSTISLVFFQTNPKIDCTEMAEIKMFVMGWGIVTDVYKRADTHLLL